jgi:Flp pilus assembly CpaF family ATPase
MEPNQKNSVKSLLAVIAASAIIAVAALVVAFGQERAATVMGGGMSTGQTTTQTAVPRTLTTSIVSPTMKAPRPKGF